MGVRGTWIVERMKRTPGRREGAKPSPVASSRSSGARQAPGAGGLAGEAAGAGEAAADIGMGKFSGGWRGIFRGNWRNGQEVRRGGHCGGGGFGLESGASTGGNEAAGEALKIMKHENKIALVTGSSRGLGRAIALHLARSGADVIITYRSKREEADAVAAEIVGLGRRAAVLALNVAEVKTFAGFAEQLKGTLEANWGRGTLDFLVNNAGIDLAKPFGQFSEEDFDALMNVHLKGVFFLTQTLVPLIAEGGRIVNTSTGLARFTIPGYSAYAAMKGAVEVLTRYLAKELGARKISVNAVAPGIIETDFTREALERPGADKFFAQNIALGRVGQPDDIGAVVNFLCSDDGRWVNGQRVEASGGMLL